MPISHLIISKGSICINRVSLTVVDPEANEFSVAIIPYTYEHTTFHQLKIEELMPFMIMASTNSKE